MMIFGMISMVSGYVYDEIANLNNKNKYLGVSPNSYHMILGTKYGYYESYIFKLLSEGMHFSSVIYDRNNKSLMAGVTILNESYTNLYYGYPNDNYNEVMYSNDYNTLEHFCSEVYEIPSNTYMKDGKFYNISGEEELGPIKRLVI